MDLILPTLVLAAAVAGLALGVEPIPGWFYPLRRRSRAGAAATAAACTSRTCSPTPSASRVAR